MYARIVSMRLKKDAQTEFTKTQMQKLWGFDAFICDALVDALVAAQVLRRTSGGSYVIHGTAP